MKKNILITLAAALALTGPALSAPDHEGETAIAGRHCIKIGGIPEFRLQDGARVDCLKPKVAIEYDFGKGGKPYECGGQAFFYARETGRAPQCILIHRHTEQSVAEFIKYTRRALVAFGDLMVVSCINTDGEDIDCATGAGL